MNKVFIIAEAGVNHNGSIELAKKLIDVAVEAKVDAVKFQTFKAENLVSKNAQKADYQKETTNKEESQFDMIKKLITVFIVLISFVSCGQDKEKIFTYMVGETEEVTVKYIDTIDKINEIKVSVVISTNQISIRRSEEVFKINNGKLIKYSYYLDNLVSIDAEATEDYIEGQDYHEIREKNEIIVKLQDQKAESVVDALDRLERKWGDMFSKVFRSITVDNGVEFSDCKGMERSALTPGEKRTYLFYCHPYSSYERGTNENTNKLIRRHIPKGEDFDEKQDRDIEFIENWINTYPRGIFGFRTSEELFKEELEKITA